MKSMRSTASEWYWTGRNNALDGHYWPPGNVGLKRQICYRLGWLTGWLELRRAR